MAQHVISMMFSEYFIAFKFDFNPNMMFIGIYIPPEGSFYFTNECFSKIASLFFQCNEYNIIPFAGGDYNSRAGNFNELLSLPNIRYNENCDLSKNSHGRVYFKDLCDSTQLLPVNHLIYKNYNFEGDFTYYKADTKSQIDLLLTGLNGVKLIENFSIINTDWHISDHRPITAVLKMNSVINSSALLKRSRDLNFEDSCPAPLVKRYNKQYNMVVFNQYLVDNAADIETNILYELDNNNVDSALQILDKNLDTAHRCSLIKQNNRNVETSNNITRIMNEANIAFLRYQAILGDSSILEETRKEIIDNYSSKRKALSSEIILQESLMWKKYTSDKDSKSLWDHINWKGNYSKKQPNNRPTIEEQSSYYEQLYKLDDENDKEKIESLTSNVSIPILDEPITIDEVKIASTKMRKGGYDYSLGTILALISLFLPVLTCLMNAIFYLKYPLSLTISLLTCIPKTGNLSLPKNYRGIQIQKAFALLYDRIIFARLQAWIGISDEQSAFQKGKSTLHQLFTIQILYAISKSLDTPIYIGLFDISKAFDRVSRYLLFKKLIRLGISYTMLAALKLIYSNTACILSFFGETSELLNMFTGIRQGVPSSVLLFLVFIDDLISYLKRICTIEPIIHDMHCLLHADDTAIISTDRNKFIGKCNSMLQYFHDNKLEMNFDKSGYLIFNAKDDNHKINIQLNNGYLKYKKSMKYLGNFICDDGGINSAIDLYLEEKRSNVTIKFTNFCMKNIFAPLDIKKKVLKSCICSTLTYGCETWGKFNDNKLETIYRTAIKTMLNIRQNTNNEIVYIESDLLPLACMIKEKQFKFWNTIYEQKLQNPTSHLSKLIDLASSLNCPYLKYYKELSESFSNPEECYNDTKNNFMIQWQLKFNNSIDEDSKLATYKSINPQLKPPKYDANYNELDRITITRYRTGSHSLAIERGRWVKPKLLRENRICICGNNVQTIKHCLLECSLLNNIRHYIDTSNIENAITSQNINVFLNKMEIILKI